MSSDSWNPGGSRARLADLRLIVLDVDGVLTDGTLHYSAAGEQHKAFHVRDGLGIKRLLEAGIAVAVVTGRGNDALLQRLGELGVEHVVTGCNDKWAGVAPIADKLGIAPEAIACVGDDVLDLPVMERVGLGIAVADAHPEVRRRAGWVTSTPGGRGAVREIADAIRVARDDAATRFRVVIPARWASTRLPGKPLRDIAGKPMIAHVIDRARDAGGADVVVATDDDRIARVAGAMGARAVMTAAEHVSGTDRLAEVADREGWAPGEIVVNLQGDEPGMFPLLIRAVARALARHPAAGIATAATPIADVVDLFDPGVVKVVLDDAHMASYFSRAPIPWVRGVFDASDGLPVLPEGVPFLRHLGLYAYRVGVLRQIAAAQPAPAERAESLEQLRALALGIPIHVTVTDRPPPHGVDTEADLARAAEQLGRSTPEVPG